jgi:glycine cleavage system H protein
MMDRMSQQYTHQYTWIRTEGGVATVGITDDAQKQLGDIVYVDLPKVGTTVEADTAMGTVESVKSVSELISPVSGTVVEINGELADAPEKLNQDPEGSAWLVKVKLLGN